MRPSIAAVLGAAGWKASRLSCTVQLEAVRYSSSHFPKVVHLSVGAVRT